MKKWPLPIPASSHWVTFYYQLFLGKWFGGLTYNIPYLIGGEFDLLLTLFGFAREINEPKGNANYFLTVNK